MSTVTVQRSHEGDGSCVTSAPHRCFALGQAWCKLDQRLMNIDRMAWRLASGVGGGVSISVLASALFERPLPDVEDGLWYSARGLTIPVADPGSEGRVVDRRCGLERVLGTPNAWTSVGVDLARSAVVPIVGILGHCALRVQNDLVIETNDGTYGHFVESVRCREAGTGLLTVSNHCSVLDDPFLIGALVPMPLALDARRARWSVCSQEVCFSRGAMLSAFFGAGKTLPIKRGGGIDQAALGALAEKLANGDWVHVFPEGHVHQSNRIGCGRGSHENERDAAIAKKIGLLKRGTAKLIAHAPRPLLVIPFIHSGMDNLMPYDHTGKCESKIWRSNQTVRINVGAPLNFQDLIDDHERAHGPLEHYGDGAWPVSTDSDSLLYSRILARIEAVLVELQERQEAALASQMHLAKTASS